ncbi:inositol monophosphatase family protein [Saccharospirillum mangrovi]|uniref:inositol monophosphatase family protein n=1 Tax=Saccharospirillum mangrovi TaxID=2161747 RepID=UPI000D35F317|nr:inositol monophosphatase family protein [Saccharospirillum mangrovi]
MQPILTIALRAARAAADKLSYTLANIDSLTAEGDSRETVFDKAIEDAAWRARKAIRKAHQRHHIDCLQIGRDESRDYDGESVWQINIISGEANYRTGYPGYLINISYYRSDRIEAVALLDPASGDEFGAMRGRGAQLNERRLRVANVSLDSALAAIEATDMTETARWSERVAGVRVTGCGLLSLANLVAGRVQLAYADNLNAIDFAAASLLLQEAGALSGDRNGGPASAKKGELLAAAPKTFKQWLAAH